jgi:hypothetical protein
MRFSPKIAGGLGRNLDLQDLAQSQYVRMKTKTVRMDGVQQPSARAQRSVGPVKNPKAAGSQPPRFNQEVDNPLFYNRPNLLSVSVSNRIPVRQDLACAVFAVGTSEARSPATGSSSYAGQPVSFATRIGPVKFIPYNRTENVSFAPLSARELLFNTYYLYWAPLPGTAQVTKEYVRPQYPELEGCWTAMGGEAGRPPVGCNRVQLSSASFFFGRVPKVEITELETNTQNGNCLVGIEQGLTFDALGPPEEKPHPSGQCIPKYRKTPSPPVPFVVRRAAPPVPVGVAPFRVKAKPMPPAGYVTCMTNGTYRGEAWLDSPCKCRDASMGTGIWGLKPGQDVNELASCFIPPPKKKSNWVGKYDEATNRGYWENPVTHEESTWIRPEGASVWIEQYDTKNRPWWWNSDTEEHTYTKPADA